MQTSFLRSLLLAFLLFFTGAQLASAQTVTATKDDGVNPLGAKKNPGETVNYTIQINATGSNATGVTLTDPTDANTSEVAGSLNVTPVALDDTYSPIVLANTSVNTNTSSEFSVASNDYLGVSGGTAVTLTGVTITASTSASTHGTVVMTASGADAGKFTYTPDPGYTGPASFTYTISNGVAGAPLGSVTGTVNLTVGGPVIWYVNPNNGSNGTGTLANPFNNLASAITAIGVSTGHRIFIYSGGAAQTGNFVLRDDGWLVGQAAFQASDNFDTLMGIIPPADTPARPTLNDAGAKPSITNSTNDTIVLAQGNTILGVAITNTGAGADFAIIGTSINTGTIGNASPSDVTIGSSGTSGGAISLTGGSGAFSINAPITSTSGRSVSIVNRGTGVVSFSQAISNTATGIFLDNNDQSGIATFTFTGGLSLSTGANPAFTATNGGTVQATQNNTSIINTLTTTTGTALNVANTSIGGGGLTFRSINKNGNNVGIILTNTGSGTFEVSGTGTTAGSGGTIENIVGADAIQLNNTDGRVTLKNMIIEDITSVNDATDGFNTRSGVDAIHGQSVDGGLTVDNVTIRRISDTAINGTPHGSIANLSTLTTWVGLVLNNCTLENTNRFHVSSRGDETEEGIVRILGISGTVNVQNTEFENGARGLELYSASTGSVDVTVQSSEFLSMSKDITGQTTNRVGLWGFYFRGMGSNTAVLRVGDPAEANNALGNTFLNNGVASIVIEQDAVSVTGSIIASVSRNIFTVTDHLSADETGSNATFDNDFPQGGVLFRPFGGTIEAIFAANTLDRKSTRLNSSHESTSRMPSSA